MQEFEVFYEKNNHTVKFEAENDQDPNLIQQIKDYAQIVLNYNDDEMLDLFNNICVERIVKEGESLENISSPKIEEFTIPAGDQQGSPVDDLFNKKQQEIQDLKIALNCMTLSIQNLTDTLRNNFEMLKSDIEELKKK